MKAAHPFWRGLITATSRLLDIFGARLQPRARSWEDDALNLYGDMERIGGDFDRVITTLAKDAGK